MDDYITLAKLVECLQAHLRAYGDKKVISFSAWSGHTFGLDAPFGLRLKAKDGAEINLVVPSYEHDVDKFLDTLTKIR